MLVSMGLIDWKPAVSALLLPPVPWIVLILWGAWWLRQRRPIGWLLVVPVCLSLWLGATSAVGEMLTRTLVAPPPALTPAQIDKLREDAAARRNDTALIVLGGGSEALAPEYAVSNLAPRAAARLRYGIWLSRATGLPLGFSGGVGLGMSGNAAEAEIAARIAAQEFKHPLKWQEGASRDTRENATLTVGLLRPLGIKHIVLITHGWHMPRAMRAFELAIRSTGGDITLTAAPMGLARPSESASLRWLPSREGQDRVHDALREWFGKLAGA
jgi:uncharacterized SAM-binding protein YcdF (DUF218 family)